MDANSDILLDTRIESLMSDPYTPRRTVSQVSLATQLDTRRPQMAAMRSELLDKCQHLRRLIEAGTVPDANGRKIRNGLDAQALSLATDDLFSAMSDALQQTIRDAPTVHGFPGGTCIREADSSNGPFAPIPAESVKIRTVTIGRNGASPVFLMAFLRMIESVGFTTDRWNAMQAARPGHNHQRFRADDIIPDEIFDLLRQAEKLLELEEESGRGEEAVDPVDEDATRMSGSQAKWCPPPGYVGRKTICHNNRFSKGGKNPVATTIDGWVKSAERQGESVAIVQDPANRENYYPRDWIVERIGSWNPRTPKT